MVFWRPQKSDQKTFWKHVNFEHFAAFVAQVPFWCFFVAGLHGFLGASEKWPENLSKTCQLVVFRCFCGSGALLLFFRGWASWFCEGLQKVTRKPFKHMSTFSISMALWLRCPFQFFAWLGCMFFGGLQKVSRKHFKNISTSIISMLLWVTYPFCVFLWLGFLVFWRPSKSE